MVELDAYWADEHGDEPARITSEDRLVQLLDELRRTQPAALVQLLPAGNPGAAILDVGFDGDRAVAFYSGPDHRDGCYSYNPAITVDDGAEPVLYYFMNSDTEYPATAEIAAEDAIKAACEYMRTGGQRPTTLAWQPMP
ncbi:Imm1 family immunity protein [Allokutzneria oryzae]|uniref:Imm1 family immunity protein n=1 Tax=Allokutzneria oryzae TaxID=1378989 RepID=A0ABV5ZTN2_9PSEU